jgi:zinc transport system permease protein
MVEFFHAVVSHGFLAGALIVGVLASVACGVVGTWVVTRRITYIAGSISHCVLGGMGWARYMALVHGWTWFQPIYGAMFAAVLAALIIGWVALKGKEREDTVIGAVWAIGMAVGIIFISQTPGYNEDIMGYLFGNILMTGAKDVILMVILDAVVLAVSLLLYNKLSAVCFDEEFARIRGLNVEFLYLLLLVMVGLTVVILVNVVGIVLVVALLTLPAATAGYFARSLWGTMLGAMIVCALSVVLGLAASYGPDLPTGATIIAVAGAAYLVVALYKRFLHPLRS